MELAELASKEQDPQKLISLIVEINQLLEEKQRRLNAMRDSSGAARLSD